MARIVIALVLLFVAFDGPRHITAVVTVSQKASKYDTLAGLVAALPSQQQHAWRVMWTACARVVREDAESEPVLIRTLDSLAAFHAAVGKFAWRSVGSTRDMTTELERVFAVELGSDEKYITPETRGRIVALYESLASLGS